MTDEDLYEYLDLEKRRQIIKDVHEEAGLESAVWERMKSKRLLPTGRVTIPEVLWEHMPLVVPADSEDGSGVAFVETNETTLREFGDVASPGLMAVDYNLLTTNEQQVYSAFLTAYADYMQEEVERLSREILVLKYCKEQLILRLQFAYFSTVRDADRPKLAKIDPEVSSLDMQLKAVTAERDGYKGHLSWFAKRVQQISRKLEADKFNAQLVGSRGFDPGQRVYSDKSPTASRTRGTKGRR